jgi:hypothetical protein
MNRLVALICLVVSASQAAHAQDNSRARKAAPSATVTPARVHRPTQRQAAARVPPGITVAQPVNNTQLTYADALRRYGHKRHDRIWWKRRFTTIVLVGGGYYYCDGGYWYPAWGYDPAYESFDYDGPIYTYGNLLPDQVIVNVQRALSDAGYYSGGFTGSLAPATRAAIAAYQRDAGLAVTAVVDAPTVQSLGLD